MPNERQKASRCCLLSVVVAKANRQQRCNITTFYCIDEATMSLQKILEPLMKPAARFYQARLGKELNKMGK